MEKNIGIGHVRQALEAQIKRHEEDILTLKKQINILNYLGNGKTKQVTLDHSQHKLYLELEELPQDVQECIKQDIIWARKNKASAQSMADGRILRIENICEFRLTKKNWTYLIEKHITEPNIEVLK